MPLAKLVCPKCRATLKPAKPVPEGKTVKCPKCEETFKAGGKPSAEKDPAPAKKSAAAAKSAPVEETEAETYAVLKDEDEERKKAAAEERKQRKKKRKRADGEDDEDEDEDEEEEEEEKDIASEYLESLKPRDPRGAAQETIVGPANWLLRTALIGFFGWVGYFVAFTLPIAFPNRPNKDEAEQAAFAPGKKEEKKKEKKQAFHFWTAEGILHGGKTEDQNEDFEAWSIIVFVLVLIVGLAQVAAIANASVKMQSLESYKWGLWGCILAIIPLITLPWFVFITFLFDLADWLLEMDIGETCWMIGLVAFAWGPVVGGLCLKQFLQPQVKPGFEYKPES